MRKFKIFGYLFFIVFVVQMYAEYTGNTTLRILSKPLIVICLLFWLFVSTRLKEKFHQLIFAGLVCALAGDILLSLQIVDPSFFMFGLIAFLFCHLCYFSAFLLDYRSSRAPKNSFFFWMIAVFAAFCAGFFFYLKPNLGSLQIPVLVYTLVISAMGVMAASRFGRVNLLSFELVFYGALFFIFSDSILAYNKFIDPLPASGIFVMSSYMLAQYFIVYGSIERKLQLSRLNKIN